MQAKPFQFRRTTVITVGLFAFLLGLGLARTGTVLPGPWAWILLVMVDLSFRHLGVISLLAVIAFGIAFGWWRGRAGYCSTTCWMW